MRILIFIIYLTLIQAFANPYEKGKDLYFQKGCANCHGTQGEGTGYYPKLTNRSKNYIAKRLTAFKEGKSTTQKQEIMFTFTNSLTDQDMSELSTFLSNFQLDTSDKYKINDDILGSVD